MSHLLAVIFLLTRFTKNESEVIVDANDVVCVYASVMYMFVFIE